MKRPPPIDLAADRFGGRALLANDEFFAPKERLLLAAPAVFVEGKYTTQGKWMDGWETRRRRTPGHDWCVVRLGLPGRIHTVVVDTSHFRGNHPEAVSLDACTRPAGDDDATLAPTEVARWAWHEIVSRQQVRGHFENCFAVDDGDRVTHVRLNIHPDGGVARLRLLGEPLPDPVAFEAVAGSTDLVAIEHGGLPLAASDAFFSTPIHLLLPGRGVDMGDGWETRRRRGPGHDWVVLRLGRRGTIDAVVVDTAHFKGNYPDRCALEGCDTPGVTDVPDDGCAWFPLLAESPLGPDTEHRFDALLTSRPVTHVRLRIFPDGGVSRLRVLGHPVPVDDDR